MKGTDSIVKGSAYLLGALTGVAFMVPLTAGALATGSLTRAAPTAIAIEAFGPEAGVRQAHLVNRTAKAGRLDMAPENVAPENATENVAPAPAASEAPAASPVPSTPARAIANSQPEPAPVAPTRATRTPKGCLSALGVTKSSLSTEELTICVADASIINRL